MNNDGALVGADDSNFVEVAGMVGSDEHRHSFVEVFDEDRIVEGVEDDLIADTVLSRTICDSWLVHKLPCPGSFCEITCDTNGLIR